MRKKIQFWLAIFTFLFLNFSLSAQTIKQTINRVRSFDVQSYTIRTSFNRAEKIVFGDTIVQLKPLKDNFKTFELDAAEMNFESIKLASSNADVPFKTAGEKIILTLDKAYSPNDLISIRFKYSTNKPKKGIYFIDAETEDGKTPRRAQVWTQGEAEEARYWFPSYDSPDDKATTEQFITVEKDETAIANGDLLETIENPDGTKTFHYKMTVPHSTYLTSFVVGNYVRVSDSYKTIPLGFYMYSGQEAIAQKSYGKTKEMMRVYEELTGVDFPYNKYDQTIVANFNFGGMENITATTMADTEILFNPPPVVEDLVSHELAHSWFGDLVTCKNWSELWLNEGFATFMEAAYREKMYGREDYLRKMREDAAQFFVDETINRNRHPLFNQNANPKDDGIFDVTTYQKGGSVIHTLRETVGTENFWKAINIYLNRYKFQNVETPDLQKAMEETSGMKLDWFFKQWIYGAGFPKLNVKPVYDTATKTLNLSVTQTQTADKITPEAFVLPMEIEITTVNGTTSEKIEVKKRAEIFSIKVSGKPSKITFDKEEKIPLKLVKMQSIATVKRR